PPPEPAVDCKVPVDSDMKGRWGPRSAESIAAANKELDGFASLLRARGIHVDRPTPIDFGQGVQSPTSPHPECITWSAYDAACRTLPAAAPRRELRGPPLHVRLILYPGPAGIDEGLQRTPRERHSAGLQVGFEKTEAGGGGKRVQGRWSSVVKG